MDTMASTCKVLEFLSSLSLSLSLLLVFFLLFFARNNENIFRERIVSQRFFLDSSR